jgi:1-carboxybiuret hydrolase subunit AtzG-like protein
MPQDDPLDNVVDGAAALLGLAIAPEWKPAVRMNLDLILRQARLVDEFALPDEAEPASVFRA